MFWARKFILNRFDSNWTNTPVLREICGVPTQKARPFSKNGRLFGAFWLVCDANVVISSQIGWMLVDFTSNRKVVRFWGRFVGLAVFMKFSGKFSEIRENFLSIWAWYGSNEWISVNTPCWSMSAHQTCLKGCNRAIRFRLLHKSHISRSCFESFMPWSLRTLWGTL